MSRFKERHMAKKVKQKVAAKAIEAIVVGGKEASAELRTCGGEGAMGDEMGGHLQQQRQKLSKTANDQTLSLGAREHMLAGAFAGTAEHLAMFPVDTVKTRMQMLGIGTHSSQPSGASALSSVLRAARAEGGFVRLWRGWSAVGIGAGPAHAVHFATYECVKKRLGGAQPGHSPLATAAGGACATIAADAVMVPHDTIKSRLQSANSPYRNLVDCVWKTYVSEGIGAFYRSYQTTLIMNVPFTAVHFASYESSKIALRQLVSLQANDEGPLVQGIAGAASGGLAAAVTTPLDVAKTRLQATPLYSSSDISHTLARIWREEGTSSLLKGLRPRVLFHVPASTICWITYETGKVLLSSVHSPFYGSSNDDMDEQDA